MTRNTNNDRIIKSPSGDIWLVDFDEQKMFFLHSKEVEEQRLAARAEDEAFRNLPYEEVMRLCK